MQNISFEIIVRIMFRLHANVIYAFTNIYIKSDTWKIFSAWQNQILNLCFKFSTLNFLSKTCHNSKRWQYYAKYFFKMNYKWKT